MRGYLKPENRRPKEGRNPNPEGTHVQGRCHVGAAELHLSLELWTSTHGLTAVYGFRNSDFCIRASDIGLLSGFGFRVSDLASACTS
jgi:hypothetical protein